MKWFAKHAWVFASALAAVALISCAKSGNNGSNGVLNPQGIIPPWGNCVNGVCPQQTSQLAFYSQNSLMDQYYQSIGYQANPNAQMQVGSGMKDINHYAMSVCDRNYSDGGIADCTSWFNGYHDMVIVAGSLQAQTVKVVIRSYPQIGNAWYSYSLPSFSQFLLGAFGFSVINNYPVYNPLILTMSISPFNYSHGFELRGYGPRYSAASGILFQIQVPNGKLEDAAFNYNMYFNGVNGLAASGSMAKCATLNCGLPFAL